jgi:uncharacterized phage protein (TIGR02218 family)
MKAGTPGLAAWLASARTAVCADLYTITLQSGTVLRLTSCDRLITWASETWVESGPVLTRGRVKVTLGAEVGTLSMSIAPKPGQTLAGLSWMEAIRRGLLDNAELLLQRAYMPNWQAAVVGLEERFYGRVADIEVARAGATLEVRSPLELLDTMVPGERYQPQCRNTWGDAHCGVAPAFYETTKAVLAGSTVSALNFSDAQTPPYYALGRIQFLSGTNNGAYRSIKVHTSGQVQLIRPLHALPAPGDLFAIRSGCDRTRATCSSKFNNLNSLRGEPFIPKPETQQ